MRLLITKSAGFCFGVKRTVELALKESAQKGKIYTFGPIIHNPQVVKYLETQNIHATENISEIPESSTVVIRTHGATIDDLNGLRKSNLTVIDGTCTFVLRPQRMVKGLSEQGYFIVIVGDEKHPEIKGVKSRADGNVMVINPSNTNFKIPKAKKIAVIAQTTLPMEDFESVIRRLRDSTNDIKVVNTICRDTSIRQNESKRLAKKTDVVLVIGGRNSANTNKLTRLCREINRKTYHIESEEEIKSSWVENADSAGITAGASTPDWLIERIIKRIKEVAAVESTEAVD
ncbi:MAG TPA: 4-hydroxy-3-methylbut-2-enyl diphosphate reductase [bacterium]